MNELVLLKCTNGQCETWFNLPANQETSNTYFCFKCGWHAILVNDLDKIQHNNVTNILPEVKV